MQILHLPPSGVEPQSNLRDMRLRLIHVGFVLKVKTTLIALVNHFSEMNVASSKQLKIFSFEIYSETPCETPFQ